jgi:hypothetical protein
MTEIPEDFAIEPRSNPTHARSRKRCFGALLATLAALPASAWLWGFTVDDALITARVAAHVARGIGYRFNPHGPLVDAVTPLGYAQLLSLFGHGEVLAVFSAAKWLGLGAWLIAAALLGWLLGDAGDRWRRFTPLGIVALSAPLAAWAVSGMETGLVTLFATLGLLGGAGGALSLGIAAAWRPELTPFALTLVAARARSEGSTFARAARCIALTALPVALGAVTRGSYFGRLVPLSFYAKPSDFGYGLRYALGAAAFTGLPWLLLATPGELERTSRRARPLLIALCAHWFALVLCGGDWMSLYRLAVPVLPCAALAAGYIAEQARPTASAVRFALALLATLILVLGRGAPARRVGAQRAALVAEARPVLAHDPRIAALDVGWLGAATDADVLDFAGVTDQESAFFPGGHSSKQIPRAWLFAHRPTAIVLLLAPGQELQQNFADSRFARTVEQRVAYLVESEFRVRRTLALGEQTYVVLEPVPTQ